MPSVPPENIIGHNPSSTSTPGSSFNAPPALVTSDQKPLQRGHSQPSHMPTPLSDTSAAASLPPALIQRASQLLAAKFPDLAFLHQPTVARDCRELAAAALSSSSSSSSSSRPAQVPSTATQTLYTALVALVAPLLEAEDAAYVHRERLSERAARDVMLMAVAGQNIITVQALLLLSVKEWGSANADAAWMYAGMALRMIQILSCRDGSSAVTSPSTSAELEPMTLDDAIFNRTFWACFIVDRTIVCNQPQPMMLPLGLVTQWWPWGNQDFLFGEHNGEKKSPSRENMINMSLNQISDIDQAHRLIVEGIEIWSDISRWVVSGGRRRFPREIPWEQGSKWTGMYDRVRHWRMRHGKRLCYPETSVEIHISGGNGELFGFLNLIYYGSILWLIREWIPFLPTPTDVPVGPTDPPLLPNSAPTGWWSLRYSELFNASSMTSQILYALSSSSAPLVTPFAGICAFSAATMNIYVHYFPLMNHSLSRDVSTRDVQNDTAYLDEFRRLWPLGKAWWATTQNLKELYERASQDGPSFRGGKTRNDYLALESSIHDASGMPAEEHQRTPNVARRDAETIGEERVRQQQQQHQELQGHADQAAALSLQELSQGPEFASDWSEVWSLMGEFPEHSFGLWGPGSAVM